VIVTYPVHREADVVLRNGSTVHVRPVRSDDHDGLLAFLRSLSPDSIFFRFFSGSVDLEKAARWAVDVDYRNRYGLVVTSGPEASIVGHGTYQSTGDGRAEVAFAVSDALQGQGLGTILLAHLAEAATENSIGTFYAEVLPANHRMVEVFRESGFPVEIHSEPGLIVVELPTSISPEAIDRFEMREQTAAVAAMRAFFAPKSVAVIGSSRRRGTIGGEVFHNLISTGFNGPVYPVNPSTDVVQSVAAYKSVIDCPGPVDQAVIVVPAVHVLDAARECAAKGVRTLVIISAGFSETGEDGLRRQRALMAVCREAGMRVIGPNCMGIINTAPDVRLNATFAPDFPPAGRVGFLSQSGALGLSVIDYAKQLRLGISTFASAGNKADISGNDLVNYWESDEDTDLILLYLESFGNPRKFARIARRVGKKKPIVVVKSGRSAAGARATSSHTGALIAASDITVDALFRQAGVIRTATLEGLFDVASLLANQPPPKGKRVGILTNAGGPGILCADACESAGLEVSELSESAVEELKEFLPAEAAVVNPVDMIASATPEDYRKSIEVLAKSGDVDAIIVIFIPPLVTRSEDAARAIRTAVREINGELPVLAVFMSARGVPPELREGDVGIPSYAFPEDAALALARVVDYGIWRSEPEGTVIEYGRDRRDEAASVVAQSLADGPGWLSPDAVATLLKCYEVPLADQKLARSEEEVGTVVEAMGGSVALKAVAPGLIHKTEAGGVRLGVAGREEATRVAAEMADGVRAAGHELEAVLVQRMVPQGVEMLVGVVNDKSFGPVIACGAGGTTVELLKDVQVRITPLTDTDAHEMVRGLAVFPLLEGYRGAARSDIPALERILMKISSLVESHPEIAEMDCNPVVVLPEGAVVVDARIRVESPGPQVPLLARRNV
jgi:acetate---CoA ligase (ADP-forming)